MRARVGGISYYIHEQLIGVTFVRTVGQVMDATKSRIAEVEADMVKRSTEIRNSIKNTPIDVDVIRVMVERFPAGAYDLDDSIADTLWNAAMMNMEAAYIAELRTLVSLFEAESENRGWFRQLELRWVDRALLLPFDPAEMERNVPSFRMPRPIGPAPHPMPAQVGSIEPFHGHYTAAIPMHPVIRTFAELKDAVEKLAP